MTEGLFGPESVTWRVHGDPVMWVAGVRALLLQAVHPVAMAGVLEHSDFRADPWGRLRRTADFVGTVSFAPGPDVERVGARVRQLHRRVRGVDRVTGRSYRAEDPELLLWVHCCEVDSFLSTYRRSGGRLSDAEADAYLAEQTRSAEVVGLDPTTVPASAAELDGYFGQMRPQLLADRRTRAAARYVLFPPMPTWAWLTPVRPAWAAVAGLALGLLPPWVRRLYGLPGLPLADHAATAQLRLLSEGVRVLPRALSEGPHQRAARLRISAASLRTG